MPDLTELQRLAEGATPGEWFYQEQSDVYTREVKRRVCECGKRHGWSGSFEKPGPDAKWSGKAPAGVLGTAEQTRKGDQQS